MSERPHVEPGANEPDISQRASLFGQLTEGVRRRRGLLIASLVVGVLSLWLLERGALPIFPDARALSRAPWWLPVVFTVLSLGVLAIRSHRFRYLLDPLVSLPLREILAVNFVFLGANFVLPLRLGEVVRPALLRRPGRLSAWQVAAVVGAERIIDGLLGSLVLAISLALAPSPPGLELDPWAHLVRPTGFLFVVAFAGGFVLLLAFYFFRTQARSLAEKTLGWVSLPLAQWVADKVERLADGLQFFSHGPSARRFLVSSLLFWFSSVLSIWVLLRGVGIDATLAQAGVVLGVLALGLLVPGAPGFFGIFQVSVYAALALYLSPEEVRGSGSVVVFWLYLGHLTASVLPALFAWPLSFRALAEAPRPRAPKAEPPVPTPKSD